MQAVCNMLLLLLWIMLWMLPMLRSRSLLLLFVDLLQLGTFCLLKQNIHVVWFDYLREIWWENKIWVHYKEWKICIYLHWRSLQDNTACKRTFLQSECFQVLRNLTLQIEEYKTTYFSSFKHFTTAVEQNALYKNYLRRLSSNAWCYYTLYICYLLFLFVKWYADLYKGLFGQAQSLKCQKQKKECGVTRIHKFSILNISLSCRLPSAEKWKLASWILKCGAWITY